MLHRAVSEIPRRLGPIGPRADATSALFLQSLLQKHGAKFDPQISTSMGIATFCVRFWPVLLRHSVPVAYATGRRCTGVVPDLGGPDSIA